MIYLADFKNTDGWACGVVGALCMVDPMKEMVSHVFMDVSYHRVGEMEQQWLHALALSFWLSGVSLLFICSYK